MTQNGVFAIFGSVVWRHALAPEPRAARQGLESGHTLIVYGLGTLA